MRVFILQFGLIFLVLIKLSVSYIPLECLENVVTDVSITRPRPTIENEFRPVVCDASISTIYEAEVNNYKEYIYVYPSAKVSSVKFL